jgi:hypothetical protein
MLNKAIAAIEDENDSLAGVLKNNIDFNAKKGKTKTPILNKLDRLQNEVKCLEAEQEKLTV